jgi:hypothetical protein
MQLRAVRAAQAHISKTQTALFSLFFAAFLPLLRQKLIRRKDQIPLAGLALIRCSPSGGDTRHLAIAVVNQ